MSILEKIDKAAHAVRRESRDIEALDAVSLNPADMRDVLLELQHPRQPRAYTKVDGSFPEVPGEQRGITVVACPAGPVRVRACRDVPKGQIAMYYPAGWLLVKTED